MDDILELVGVDASPYQTTKVNAPQSARVSSGAETVARSTVSTQGTQQALAQAAQTYDASLDNYSKAVNERTQRDIAVGQAQAQENLRKSMVQAANNAQRGDVLSSLAQTAAGYLLQREQTKQANAEKLRKQYEETLKQQRKSNYTTATVELGELISSAQAEGYDRDGTIPWTQKALEAINKYDLDDEDKRSLITSVYKTRDEYEGQARTKRDEQVKQARLAAREREKQQLLLTLQPVLAPLKDNPTADVSGAMQQVTTTVQGIFNDQNLTQNERDELIAAVFRESQSYIGSSITANGELMRMQNNITEYRQYEQKVFADMNAGSVSRTEALSQLDQAKLVLGLSNLRSVDPMENVEYQQRLQQLTQQNTKDLEAALKAQAETRVVFGDDAINARAYQLANSYDGSELELLEQKKGELTSFEQRVLVRGKAIKSLLNKQVQLTQDVAKVQREYVDLQANGVDGILSRIKSGQTNATDMAVLSSTDIPQELKARMLAGQYTQEDVNEMQNRLQSRLGAVAQEAKLKEAELQNTRAQLAQFGITGDMKRDAKFVNDGSKKYLDLYSQYNQTLGQMVQVAGQQQQQMLMQQTNLGVQSSFKSEGGTDALLPPGNFTTLPRVKSIAVSNVAGKNLLMPFATEDKAKVRVTGEHAENRGTHKHAGVDYAAPEGTRIVSPINGVVTKVDNEPRGYGYYVTIKGSDGMLYRYAHLKQGSIRVKKGDKIAAGSVFAQVGNTGRSSGAHLHFEVRDAQHEYGFEGTQDPTVYLASTQFKASSERAMRSSGIPTPVSNNGVPVPTLNVPGDAAALGGNYFVYNNQVLSLNPQTVTAQPVANAQAVYNNAKPMANSYAHAKHPGGRIKNDTVANYGYASLAKDKEFAKSINEVADKLNIPGQWLADVIELESNFSASIQNGIGATGLIQFIPSTAKGLGYTTDQIKSMSRPEQMRTAVYKYLKGANTQFKSIHELYVYINGGGKGLEALRKNPLANWTDDPAKKKRWRNFHFLELGKEVGRQYELPGSDRRTRLAATHTSYKEGCRTCASLAKANSFVPHEPQA